MMGPAEVIEVLEALAADEVSVWLDGGWGVDALVGEQTRPHLDLDLVIARPDCPRAGRALRALGFAHAPEIKPGLPARLVLHATGDRRVDLHPVVFDATGNGWQELPGGGWGLYPVDGLCGRGKIAGRRVPCITPELQLRHHLGYPLDDTAWHDLALLASYYDLALPPSPIDERPSEGHDGRERSL
jgi:lincosamide nucleotidyltransferase A/C/D/E